LHRVREQHPEEVILALGADVEGEATAGYVADILRDTGVSVTRLAQGMPAGGGLEHADEMTLHHALSGRRKM
jgi:recombination protein RecR